MQPIEVVGSGCAREMKKACRYEKARDLRASFQRLAFAVRVRTNCCVFQFRALFETSKCSELWT